MDSSSTALGEENQVIEQNVKIHHGDTPNISCLLPKDEKANTDEAALEIAGGSAANRLPCEENGNLHQSAENLCAKILEEDSAFKEALAVRLDQSPVDTSVRAALSSSSVRNQKTNAGHPNRAKTKVVLQNGVAEGLLVEWTKEIKVTKNGNVKKDPYYTDPVSGFVFWSMKDVLRYLKTRDIGRPAFKPNDKSSSDMELEEEETPARESESPLTRKKKLVETLSSQRNEGMEDLPEKVLPPSHVGPFEELPFPTCARDKSEDTSPKLSKAVQMEQSEERN